VNTASQAGGEGGFDENDRVAIRGTSPSLTQTTINGHAVGIFTGVTEPIEFTFMFLAPALYAVHALLTGIAFIIMNAVHVRLGFNFSAALFDNAELQGGDAPAVAAAGRRGAIRGLLRVVSLRHRALRPQDSGAGAG
jgi:hypothetical protein